jgi:hypothetical protein
MSKGTERKIILNMLETGTIDSSQAQNLLQALSPKRSRNHTNSNTIVVEMAADEENVRNVLEKLGKAIFG